MGTNCAPLLADLFLHSYEAEFVQKLLRDNNKKLPASFNHTFRYKSSFRKFYGRYNDLVCGYNLSLAHMLNDLFHTIC